MSQNKSPKWPYILLFLILIAVAMYVMLGTGEDPSGLYEIGR